MGLLNPWEILELHAAIVSVGLGDSRVALLAGLRPAFVLGLPKAGAPGEQLLVDLNAINDTVTLADGTVPLAQLVLNVLALAGARREEEIFRRMLQAIEHASVEEEQSDDRHAPVAAHPAPRDVPTSAVLPPRADVLIVTALKQDYDEALRVDTGALDDAWASDCGLAGFEVAFRSYRGVGGHPLRIALTWATRMRATATADAAGRLIDKLGVRCLAMSGVCAGRRGKVSPGDVIIASLLYTYDAGGLRAEWDEQGRVHQRFQADPDPVPLDEQWRHRAQAFEIPKGDWLAGRPIPLDQQGDWLLERLRLEPEADPARHPNRKARSPAWAAVIARLRQRKLISEQAPLTLTEAGRRYIDDLLLLHPDGFDAPPPPQVHLGPIATGSSVMRDPQLFERLSDAMREVLGVEMEAAAIGAIAHARKLPWVVMKGVMDHADHDNDDRFKAFAARASAECLVAFLRENLPPVDGAGGTRRGPSGSSEKKVFFRVHQLIEAGDLNGADRELARLPEAQRSSAEFWYWRSNVALARRNVDVASAYVEEALRRDARHVHGIVLRIKLLLLSTRPGDRDRARELAARTHGITAALDTWLRSMTAEGLFGPGVRSITELDTRCQAPEYAWTDDTLIVKA